MDPSTRWFLVLALLSALSLWLGTVTAKHTRNRGGAGLILCLILMAAWAWLLHHPSVAVRLIPVSVLSRIEGTAGVPMFMFIIGIAWVRAMRVSQKRLVAWAMVLGVVYFVQGGLWLIQSTPSVGFAETAKGSLVRQSQDYSCVPAACATALNYLGVTTSEAEMARLTETRPGTGSTLLRALDALQIKLAGTSMKPELIELKLDELVSLPTPALTPIQFESTRRHMIVISRVTKSGVWIADPNEGVLYYDWDAMRPLYTGQVIVIDGFNRR